MERQGVPLAITMLTRISQAPLAEVNAWPLLNILMLSKFYIFDRRWHRWNDYDNFPLEESPSNIRGILEFHCRLLRFYPCRDLKKDKFSSLGKFFCMQSLGMEILFLAVKECKSSVSRDSKIRWRISRIFS